MVYKIYKKKIKIKMLVICLVGILIIPSINVLSLSIKKEKTQIETPKDTTFIDTITFIKTYDYSDTDWIADVEQTRDGGYIFLGYSDNDTRDYCSAWLVKTDAYGSKEWDKSFRETDKDIPYDVIQTSDGGYILTVRCGLFDKCWIFKTDSNGEIEWKKNYNNFVGDGGWAESIIETSDGGFVFTGSFSDDGIGDYYIPLIKIDSSGNILWVKKFQYNNERSYHGYQVIETYDGGFAILGDGYRSNTKRSDIWFIKTDAYGNKEWDRFFHKTQYDHGCSFLETDDGYILLGSVPINDDSIILNMWIIKIDSSGDIIWDKEIGSDYNFDMGYKIAKTYDGGFVVVGDTGYYLSNLNVMLIKFASDGDIEWEKTYSPSESNLGRAVKQTSDGGYIIGGGAGAILFNTGDFLLIKTDERGDTPRARHSVIENHPFFSRLLSLLRLFS